MTDVIVETCIDALPPDPFDILTIVQDKDSGDITVYTGNWTAQDLCPVVDYVIAYLWEKAPRGRTTINDVVFGHDDEGDEDA